jgi:hypothetical protein
MPFACRKASPDASSQAAGSTMRRFGGPFGPLRNHPFVTASCKESMTDTSQPTDEGGCLAEAWQEPHLFRPTLGLCKLKVTFGEASYETVLSQPSHDLPRLP